jgi:hypothetical protein
MARPRDREVELQGVAPELLVAERVEAEDSPALIQEAGRVPLDRIGSKAPVGALPVPGAGPGGRAARV